MKAIQQQAECLNLGCGRDYRAGSDWCNVDISPEVDPDIVHDLNEYPWPFSENEFHHVEARHVLEHLNSPIQAFKELARIVRPGGSVLWVYPIGHTRFEDPTHQQYWNYHTPEALCGEREHDHETDFPFTVEEKRVDWHLSTGSLFWRSYVYWQKTLRGYGPWLSQIPGLYGEIAVQLSQVKL